MMADQQQNALCLDLGTVTGWAMCTDRILASGTVDFKNNRFEGGGMRYLRFIRWLEDVRDSNPPVCVFFEEVRRHRGTDAAHCYGGFMASLTAWCEEHSIPYAGVPVGTIKKHATGKGNANKKLMIEAAIAKGHNPADDNEADAICLSYWAIEQAA
jgi:Holliday junction resolvasome RuvABC endonuclease subunit